jgi:hypothetical protein
MERCPDSPRQVSRTLVQDTLFLPYSYGVDNPFVSGDASGLCGWLCVGGIILGVAAATTGVGAVVEIIGGASLATVAGWSAASLAFGAGALASDSHSCFANHDQAACAGVALAGVAELITGFATGGAAFAEAGSTFDEILLMLSAIGASFGVASALYDLVLGLITPTFVDNPWWDTPSCPPV